MMNTIKNRNDIINYGLERGIIQQKEEGAKAVIDALSGYKVKEEAMKTIIDASDKKNSNPRKTGKIENDSFPYETNREKNPKKYLSKVSQNLTLRIEAEEKFLNENVINNNKLSDEAKHFLKKLVSTKNGPWTRTSNVNVVEVDGKITIATRNSESYYYLKQDKKSFMDKFVVNNNELSEEAKIFVGNLVKNEKGPWTNRNFVTKVREDDGKITIKLKDSESYYYYKQGVDIAE